MPNRFFSPIQQFPNAPGGFLFFFATGTSTPIDTYSDVGLSARNANPIQLDGLGYATSIFLQPGQSYKVTLTDATGNTGSPIFTADPVIG